MTRSALDDLATRLCSLREEAANADAIARLIWQAYDAAAHGQLDVSQVLITSAGAQLDAAERQVGVLTPIAEARVLPKFGVGTGAFLTLKRGGA